jgi:sugar phosphate isomerase/epimerase
MTEGWPKLRTGLNPYGLTWHLGLQGRGTPRTNPDGKGLEGFIALGTELGAKVLELWDPWIAPMSDDEVRALRERLAALDITPVVSGGLVTAADDSLFRSARLLGADVIRFACSNVLCGDRAARADWPEIRAAVPRAVAELGRRADGEGVTICIENHQDFTSAELVEFCGLAPAVGITFDMGNTFPVAEAPLDFTRAIAPHVRHVHLKDYRVQFTPEGYRLVRCAIGDGCVPYAAMFSILGEHQADLTAVLEPGALEARHVRLFTPGWWEGYAPKSAPQLAAALLAAQVNRLPDDADYRTPWERNDDAALDTYELDMIRRSAANMRSLGIL